MSDQHLTQPLDQQFKTVFNKLTQKEEKLPAIDRFFKVERQFLSYIAPPLSILNPSSFEFQANLEEYQERLKIIEQDLKWLLSLPYQKFWCQIIYDISCQKTIDSYLKLAPRPYDMYKIEIPMQIVNLHNSIHRYVFLSCLRMSTYKESKENYLNQHVFADLIYNNYLFDVPKILDLCVLYEKNPVLNKIVENLFSSQPKFYDDFKICVKDIIKAIETSKKKLRSIFDLDSMYDIGGFNKSASLSEKVSKNCKEIQDIIYYLTDFFQTLYNLVSIQTNLAQYLFEQKFELNIKDLMESTLFEIIDIVHQLRKESDLNSESIRLIKIKLSSLKYQMAKLFNLIIQYSLVNPIVENVDAFKSSAQFQSNVDNFVKICCDILDDKRFLCYYEEKFNLSEQIDLIFEISQGKIDKSQYDYMMENLKKSILEFSRKGKLKEKFDNIKKAPTSKLNVEELHKKKENSPGASSSDLLVQSVLDFLPDLDRNLVEKCLNYYKNNVEQVINAFLENNLPEFPSEKTEQIASTNYSELSSRKNIYDNDDFDVFSKENVDLSKIHVGKKGKTDNFDLDNKEEIRRDLINYEYNEDDLYEDEYDDTYDLNTNVNDNYDGFVIKPLNQKLEIKKRDVFELDSDEEEEDEEEGEETEQKKAVNTPENVQNKNTQASLQKQQVTREQQKFQNNDSKRDDHYRQRPDQIKQNYQNKNREKFQQTNQQYQQGRQRDDYNRLQNDDQQRPYERPRGQRQERQNDDQQRPFERPRGQRQERQNDDQQRPFERPRDQRQERQNDDQQIPFERLRDQRQERQNDDQQRPYERPRDQRQEKYSQLPQRQQFKNRPQISKENEASGADGIDEVKKTEEEIKRERRWKNDNKATIAHHNRKYLSMKKTGFL